MNGIGLGRTVSLARLHTPIHIPGVGQFGPLLQKEGLKLGDLEMTLLDNGLFLTVGGKEAFIPLTQIQVLELVPAAPKSKK